ncbi:EscU/YscU/HrcU family type III secretion system export apparatus switch protein [Hydrogenimonas urashimensis]|uniref:EscU/YscU/HrcU family type III secretion system export apparatus switch protein n=1 Tax=Hydrogenimonas urashimensis TaxID=2740515 RepID=UPI0019164B62|nr:EscU/YscU/HrcU family type III secretion system export apparatus switch protein [Hydrogenimonas urashimensis]
MLTPKAAALKYTMEKDNAPKLLAAGRGEIALKIIEKAKTFDVPLFQNEVLADALLKQNLGTEIDPRLFQAVAEVFVWLMRAEASVQMSK